MANGVFRDGVSYFETDPKSDNFNMAKLYEVCRGGKFKGLVGRPEGKRHWVSYVLYCDGDYTGWDFVGYHKSRKSASASL